MVVFAHHEFRTFDEPRNGVATGVVRFRRAGHHHTVNVGLVAGLVTATTGAAVPDEEGVIVGVECFPIRSVDPAHRHIKGIVSWGLGCQCRGGHVVGCRELGVRPCDVAGINRHVGVGVRDEPVDGHGFVGQRTVGINLAGEVVAHIVRIVVGPCVNGAGRSTALVATTAAHVHHKEAVGVAIEHLPCH